MVRIELHVCGVLNAMLTIRKEQMDALNADRRAGFVRRLNAHMRTVQSGFDPDCLHITRDTMPGSYRLLVGIRNTRSGGAGTFSITNAATSSSALDAATVGVKLINDTLLGLS